MADLIFAFTNRCDPPILHDLVVPSIQFADDICNFSSSEAGIRASIECTLQYCAANRLKANLNKSCYTVFNDPHSTKSDIVIQGQMLKFDPHPCYLGVCLSSDRLELNSVMIRKASKAAFALSTMLSPSTSATLLNRLFSQLIEPILLYAVEQWIPYMHPRKVEKLGPTATFGSLSSQLNTEDVWKRMVYSHYQLSATTPILAVRSELGSPPTFIPGIARLAKYLAYLTSPDAPPLVARAVLVHKAIGASSKYGWWNNSWRLLQDLHVTPDNVGSVNLADLKDDLLGGYRRWWLQQFMDPTAHPKLCTFRLFKKSFAPSAYLNEGPGYFHPAALRFRCSSHRLDIELGRHTGTPRSDSGCRICSGTALGDEFHAFKCSAFLDLQVFCDINVTSKPQFITLMTDFPIAAQRYITLLTSRIKLQ